METGPTARTADGRTMHTEPNNRIPDETLPKTAAQPASPLERSSEEATMTDYLANCQSDFDTVAFNPVDSLVVSSLSYLNFDSYKFESVFGREPVALIDILRFTDFHELTRGSWMEGADDVADMLNALSRSRRYKDISVCFFSNETSDNIEKQFSATTFLLDGKRAYIAFRGTDGTLTGWKEDFNLSFRSVIPSQTTACLYLSGVLSALPSDLTVYTGGHSKGGNLAEYAALSIDDGQFARLAKVFNHDGPSFLQDPSPRINTEGFQRKLHKTVPESSIFGLILENRDDFHVVQSTASLVFQHNPLSWIVSGNDFLYQESLNRSAQVFDQTLDRWLNSCTAQQRELFIDTVFDLLTINQAKSWNDFQDGLLGNIAAIVYNGAKLDSETKEIILHTFGNLRESANEIVREQMAKYLPWFANADEQPGNDRSKNDTDDSPRNG